MKFEGEIPIIILQVIREPNWLDQSLISIGGSLREFAWVWSENESVWFVHQHFSVSNGLWEHFFSLNSSGVVERTFWLGLARRRVYGIVDDFESSSSSRASGQCRQPGGKVGRPTL